MDYTIQTVLIISTIQCITSKNKETVIKTYSESPHALQLLVHGLYTFLLVAGVWSLWWRGEVEKVGVGDPWRDYPSRHTTRKGHSCVHRGRQIGVTHVYGHLKG